MCGGGAVVESKEKRQSRVRDVRGGGWTQRSFRHDRE